ncbi:hypothetical protein [Planococcus salinus]|uniref:Uncharacterized protein n=1 Tax=Planococcus salinus TaxID=1848460 RepID=A0A3M8PB39_9BACL|nr:hypothetical protein [Planococcus salinus]RNF40928.1 hypothetical protein EEX84_00815 [Planococcus salinus]
MKYFTNERGYALLIVLLVVVLFLGLSATFIAGSLNNAQQEQTIDVSNQSVAAAEMGVLYYSADFELEIERVKKTVLEQTQIKLNSLIDCIKPPTGEDCDTAAERDSWEQEIDREMRKLYLEKVKSAITVMENEANNKKSPFSEEQINYLIKEVSSTEFKADNEDLTAIEIEMKIEGTSKETPNTLLSAFTVEVPDTFLNPNEAIKVDTAVVALDQDLTYDDIFSFAANSKSCGVLLEEVKAGTAEAPYECTAQVNESLASFIEDIKEKGFDPEDFRVYTQDFRSYACDNNCNNLNFEGINLVVDQNDAGAFNNMNNFVNGDLIIDGTLTTGNNLINLGKNGVKQNIIVKGLDVDNNIKNMYYTNFLVLGNEEGTDARLQWGKHFTVDNYSRLCIDIDRINQADLDRLSRELQFSNSGSLIYYSADLNKTFSLIDKKGRDRGTEVYVKRGETYTSFLQNCGVSLKDMQTMPTDVAVPNAIDTGFDFEVEY